MKINSIRSLTGRNIYSHKPVIKVILDLEELSDKSTIDFEYFNDELLHLFPSLVEHHCGLGKYGGFVERMKQGTYFGHVIEHLALELQVHLGFDVFFGKTRMHKEPSLYNVIIECKNEELAIACLKQAVYIVDSIIKKQDFNFEDIMFDLEDIRDRNTLGPSTRAIFEEAKKRNIPVRRLGSDSMLELGYGKYSRKVQAALTDSTSSIAIDISCDKQLTKQMLLENNIPVPQGDIAMSIEDALDIAYDIGYPLVLKPLNGNQGKGVVLNVNSDRELEDLFHIPLKYSDQVIVEQNIIGKDYRILVIKDKVCAVAERTPPIILGDGVHTIKELVDMENSNNLRGNNHEKPLTKIRLDKISLNYLSRQNLREYSIPSMGQVVQLRQNANMSTGGSARECTDEIHPFNKKFAIDAAKIIELDIAGIDITTEDISKPISTCGGAIIEVNAVPGLRMHLHPTEGKDINVASDIVDFLYPQGAPCSVPIISITGTNGKTTTTRLIAHTLRLLEKNVGMTTSNGTFVNNTCISKGDNTGPLSARKVLSSREIDVAVLEVARGGIVRKGLGYDLADVAVLTNIGDDHIGIDGINSIEDLAFAKSLVLEAVKPDGYCVINADSQMAEYLIERASGNVILYSKETKNPFIVRHIQNDKIALCVENNSIYIYNHFKKIRLIAIDQIPITFNGALRCNIENALAASSALYAINTPVDRIKKGLSSFVADEKMNPGRFNIFDFEKFKVMLDYGHNMDGYKEVGQFIQNLKPSRSVGIIGIPGDRPDNQIFAIGALCSTLFSKIYIKEDQDLRGREAGEVANILYQGLCSANFTEKNIEYIPCEIDALKAAIGQSEPGDFITVFYENFTPIIEYMNQLREEMSVENSETVAILR